MTLLSKKLRRETAEFWREPGLGIRPIIIEIEPPGLITFRQKGTRRRWTATAAVLMQWTIQAEIDRRRAEKKKKRRRP